VFDVNSNDTLTHQATLRHVSSMASAYPEFEVVVYGEALPMLIKGQSTVIKGIKGLESNQNVSIKVCAATMKRHNIDQSQLLSRIVIGPDAIMEIVTKQKKEWGYIKESHN
jgi:intracellular sulfur oxidation DsrE/DsrF family protein